MSFVDTLRTHLGEYKRQGLGISEAGEYQHRGKTLRKHHILPREHAQLNILEPYRSAFFESGSAKFDLHRYFHHLNSTQALCINLFYPLIAEDRLTLLLQSLKIQPEAGWTAAFEKPSAVETARHPTRFDFHLQHAEAGDIYFELKYTELDYGKAPVDAEHQRKFRTTWLPIVQDSPWLAARCRDETVFLGNYQLLRLFAHLSECTRVVLLLPAANRDIALQARKACDILLSDEGRARVSIVYLEDLVGDLERACAGDALNHYYEQFRAKYLPSLK